MAKSRAAAACCRGLLGLLPAAVFCGMFSGCRFEPAPRAGGEAAPAPPAVSAPGPGTADTQSFTGPGGRAAPDPPADASASDQPIVYHVVKGARFFDILVARIGSREHVVIGETDDMCLDLPDQRDFDGDGNRDALVFRSPRCRGDGAPGLLFFVSGAAFRRSAPFPGHRPRVERWNGAWSVLAGGIRRVLRDGRAVEVERIDPGGA